MKKFLLVAVAVVAAASATGSTVVLKGGKRLDVTSSLRQGNVIVLKYANGRVESYPVSAVDLEATRAANAAPAEAATPAPAGPHSPFFGAQAKAGKPVLVVTDEDVQHVKTEDEGEGEGQAKPAAATGEGQVVLVDYAKTKIEDGNWEITATVRNAGGAPVTGVSADVRLLDEKGASLGSGSATLDGILAPTQEAAITARVACPVEPIQIGFSFHWRAITPQPTPAPAAAGAGERAEPAKPAPANTAQAPPPPPGFTVPAGSSPNALPTNPMSVPPNLMEPPTSLQVARPQPAPDKPKA